MIQITCDKCKQEVTVPFYFHEIKILLEDDPLYHNRGYTASALGKAVCPQCGYDLREKFSCPISQDDILELATRRCVKPYTMRR